MTMKLVRGPDRVTASMVFGDLKPGQCFTVIWGPHAVVYQRLTARSYDTINASRLDEGDPRVFGKDAAVYPVTVDATWSPAE